MKLAFADRAAYLGDPDFVDGAGRSELVAKAYAGEAARAHRPAALAARAVDVGPRRGRDPRAARARRARRARGGTTHLSVADAAGNAVAITQTVNLLFGSGITVPGTGIVLNDEMDDFSVAPERAERVRPRRHARQRTRSRRGKRPLSSMTPTIVRRGRQAVRS